MTYQQLLRKLRTLGYEFNRHRIVRGYGDPQAKVMIIGEAPGYRGADRTGVPFTGDRFGQRVQALLIRLLSPTLRHHLTTSLPPYTTNTNFPNCLRSAI